MTDHHQDEGGVGEAGMAALSALLASDAVWAEPDPSVEAAILAEIEAETGSVEGLMPPRPGRADRRHLRIIGAAAMVFIGLGVAIGLLFVDTDETVRVALAGTDLAPGASATAELDSTPEGLRITLDVSGLSPAPEGFYYQAWVRNGDDGVTAGTFHMRGGDAEIELWAGVSYTDYPVVTVTRQREGGGAESSGDVVLRSTTDP